MITAPFGTTGQDISRVGIGGFQAAGSGPWGWGPDADDDAARAAIRHAVHEGARGRKTNGSGLNTLAHDLCHLLHIIDSGGFILDAPLSHYIGANSTMRNLGGDIYRPWKALQSIQVLRKTLSSDHVHYLKSL